MLKWVYDPYSRTKDKGKPVEKLDVAVFMKGQYGLSWADLEEMHLSEELGVLFGSKFLPKEGVMGWGQFTQSYLGKLKAYVQLKNSVATEQYNRSRRPIRPRRSIFEEQMIKSEVQAQNAYFMAQGRKLDLNKLPWLKASA
jgi:hypothetical protein